MSDDSSNRTDVSTINLDNVSVQNRDNIDSSNSKFIGFDLSTQQLKAIVIDDNLKVCHHVRVSFDEELSEFKTRGGVYKSDDGSNTITAPVNMWLKAMDICFDKLKVDGLDFSTVAGISGCAQQHGSVWWRKDSAIKLANLNPDDYLHIALQSSFVLRESPIWMDSSTTEECCLLEEQVGGPEKLAQITGSRAYERFTGAQIAKIIRKKPEIYIATERITLISNFMASILCGSYAPFDASDASGMNMLDIKTKRWSGECLEAIVGSKEPKKLESLLAKLGCLESSVDENIVDTHEVVGRLGRYFVDRYGFPAECLISSFTGDNPASMAGLNINREDVMISLGTSDTIVFWADEPHPTIMGHILRNPLDEAAFMGMVVFKNGSKTRERIRDKYASGNWEEFSKLLESVPRGNFGNIGFYWDNREIYPLCIGDYRYNKLDQEVDSFSSNEFEIRALLEHQFIRLYMHSQTLGLNVDKLTRVLVTGGASSNKAILQVIADIFRKPVYTLAIENSACLGSAYLAKYAYELEQQKLDLSFSQNVKSSISTAFNNKLNLINGIDDVGQSNLVEGEQFHFDQPISFSDMIKSIICGDAAGDINEMGNLTKICDPTPISSSIDVYESLLKRYQKFEQQLSKRASDFILNNQN